MLDIIKKNYHQSYDKLHVGTCKKRAYYIPFSLEQNPYTSRNESKCFISLNGKWKFRFYESVFDIEENLLERSDLFSKEINVPGVIQLQGFDSPAYINYRYPIPFNPPYVPNQNPVGVYFKSISLEKKTDKKYYLNFEGVDSSFYLYIK